MKKMILLLSLCAILFSTHVIAQENSDVWRLEQLMAPSDLASVIKNPSVNAPLIISVGPSGLIKGAINIGPTNEKENLKKLKQLLLNENRDREIVIYCGCCPFKNCPNVRPAFSLLNSMRFTNHKLLDLPHNLKADWINYGYPMNKDSL